MIRSVNLDNIDVIDIGRGSGNRLGFVTFGKE